MAAAAAAAVSADKGSSKGQAWFCTTGLPSDIIIDVDDMMFHLHKFPLISKSRKLHLLIAEQETMNPTREKRNRDEGEEEEEEEEEEGEGEIEEFEQCRITLTDFPGGSETFEMAAKFCYGVKVELTSSNVAPLRCAGEFLEMTEEHAEDNLILKTERFFSQFVLKNLKESIKAMNSCERLMPIADTLGITQKCIDSIASRASSADPALFGWPVNDGDRDFAREFSNQISWNGIEAGLRRKSVTRESNVDFWFEDLVLLSLPLFKRLISAMKARDLRSEVVESLLMHYAKKYIPGISRSNRKSSSSSSSIATESEKRELLETIIANLPLEKSSRSSTATKFLCGLLRTANILNASEDCKSTLEKKIGSQLDQATLDDLLIPSYSYLNETLYDVDCVERILMYFLDGFAERNAPEIEDDEGGGDNSARSSTLTLVGKLIDGYLSEIASDANLKPEKFYNLAISLPDQARLFDDGIYRAIDVYLKAHPWLPEAERDKICGMIDCQKLTLEACTHAAQNERLPLRAVVQVLFFEQLQLRHAIAGTLLAAEGVQTEPGRPSESLQRREQEAEAAAEEEEEDGGGGVRQRNTWRAAVRENQVLRLDMDTMRTRVHQLERECSMMKKVIQKIDKSGPHNGSGGGWTSLTRGFGCKFKTQVCDSHDQTVVETRKSRHRTHNS